jgi:Tol biopolymer transport system component
MIGSTLANYRVTAAIGAGGMGEVYRATDTKLDREVAIKVLPAELAQDPERLARFEREAKLLASLNHPNVAHVYGFESATLQDGSTTHFLAMELVEGEDLAERLKRGAIPVDESLGVAKQMAEALEEAHERGIVHRDLKPANVKLAPDGKVKVLDFGLAKAYAGDAASGSGSDLSQSPTLARTGTRAGAILGTAAYMSPEQARGKAVDKRADIWAFGVVLYEMLTGLRLFEGETVSDVLAAVLTRDPQWARLPAATPGAIRDLLRRCLRRDAKARQRDMGDARIVLEEALAGPSPQGDGPASPTRPTWRRALPWAAALAVGALISGVVMWGLALRRPQRERMHFRAVTNFAGVQAQPALSPDGGSVAFVSNRGGDYDIYVGLVSGGKLIQITHDPHFEARPSWAPDGASITYARLNDSGLWDIWQVPALGGTPRRLILNAADPAWSRDGRSLAYVNEVTRTIWVSDPAGQNARQVTTLGSSAYQAEPRFSPDGHELAFVSRGGGPRGELNVVDLGSGEARRLTQDDALAQCPAWSPDGLHLYFASSRGGAMNIWKIGARGGEADQVTAGQGDDVQPDVSADGSRIVFATYRESLGFARLDLQAKPGPDNPKQLSIDLARNQIGPAYSPDGGRLAYFSNFKGVENEGVWMVGADGSDPLPLVQDARVNIFPKWSPDGGHLIYLSNADGGGQAEYRRVAILGGTPETLLGNAADWNFDVGPDGRLLFRDEGGRVQSYDPSGQKTRELAVSPQSQNGWQLRYSPDGQAVAYILSAGTETDPLAGLWVEDFKSPPRQVFRGWVTSYARGPGDEILLLEGKADLQGVVWKVRWDGHGLNRVATKRLVHSYWAAAKGLAQNYLDVSPDGRHVVFGSQEVQQANIGMIENVR